MSMVFRAGTQFFRAMSKITDNVITSVRISFRFQPPSSIYIRFAFSFNPGIMVFSGLQSTIMSPQMRKTISQPIGAI